MRSYVSNDFASRSVAALTAKYTPRETTPAVVAPEPIDVRSLSTMQQAALMTMTENHVKRAIVARLLEDAQDNFSPADFRALEAQGLCEKPPGKTWHQLTTDGRFAGFALTARLCIAFDIHLLREGALHGSQQRWSCQCGFSTMVLRSGKAKRNAEHFHGNYVASKAGIGRLRLALAPAGEG